jgi:hypothetical protein
MGGSNMQEILGGLQIAGGTALSATGSPQVGVPMMVGGMQSATTPQGQPSSAGPLGAMNPQALSQMMGGMTNKPQPQAPPAPPRNTQTAQQPMTPPAANPPPTPPQMPQQPQPQSSPMNAQSIQAMIQQLLGGTR